MSDSSSTTPPARSSAADSEAPPPETHERILDAGALLADSGVFGLVWIDVDLVVTATYGRLAQFVATGRPVTESLIALVGLEETIGEVRTGSIAGHPSFLDLPAVAIRGSDAPETRLNLTLYWLARWRCYLLLVARALPRSNLEQQLTQQMRARLMAEADSRALAKRLAIANRDLEEFASIISHDLRAPMRALRYLVEEAETLATTGAGADLTTKLGHIKAQSQRMTAMLGALYEYSSTGHKAALVERIDTRELLTTILGSLPGLDRFLVRIDGDWPVLDTVAAALQIVLRNLIENASKYHDQPAGILALTAEPTRGYVVFTVADDGPGIPVELQHVAFLPFRRLPGAGNVDGSGMGLALVKRTVESVGGRIELSSDPAVRRGATFRISWPSEINTETIAGVASVSR